MLFDLTFPCYLTTFSEKKCLSGKVICAFFCPAYRSSPVLAIFVFRNARILASERVCPHSSQSCGEGCPETRDVHKDAEIRETERRVSTKILVTGGWGNS
jgi:hypothetical protein